MSRLDEEYYHPLYHPEKVWRNKTGVIVAIVALVLVVFVMLFVLAWSLILTFAAPSTIQQNPEFGAGFQFSNIDLDSSASVDVPQLQDETSNSSQNVDKSMNNNTDSDIITIHQSDETFGNDKVSVTVRLKKPLKRYPTVK